MPIGKRNEIDSDRGPATARDVRVTSRHLILNLSDGREISIPLSFYPTLAKATSAERSLWELIGAGKGIAWDSLDLHLSVQSLLDGAREGIPRPPLLGASSAGKSRRKSA